MSNERPEAKLEASAEEEESTLTLDSEQPEAEEQIQQPEQVEGQPEETEDFNFHQVARETGYEVSDEVSPADFLRQQREAWQQQQQEVAYYKRLAEERKQPEPVQEADPEPWELEKFVRQHVGLPERDPQWDVMERQGIVVRNPETGFYEPTQEHEYIRGSEALQKLNEYAYKERQFEPMMRIARMNQEIARREAQSAHEQASRQQQEAIQQKTRDQAASEFQAANADLLNDPRKRAVLEEELGMLNPNLPADKLLATAKERTLARIAASPQQPGSPQPSSQAPQTLLQKAARSAVSQSSATGAPTDLGRAADGSDGIPFGEFWQRKLEGVQV